VGLVPKIYKMIEDMPMISLALSLHAPDQELRERIVPTAKAYQIEKILQAAFDFLQHQNDEELRAERRLARHKRIPNTAAEQKENISVNGEEDAASISTKHTMVGNSAQNRRRKLMLEYVLLGPDVNCSVEVAHRLGKLLSSSESWLSNCLLNVIPYNPTTAGEPHGYRPPSQPVINEFLVTVRSYGGMCIHWCHL
jgi:sorting nexin-8